VKLKNIKKTNIKNLLVAFSFLVFLSGYGWSISFPQCNFFPVKPNYSYTVYSEKGNSITFEETIELPEEVELGVWSIWKIKLYFTDGTKEEYILRFWINNEGEGFLSTIKDKGYERSFLEMPKVFPLVVEKNKEVTFGSNFYIVYRGEYSRFVHPTLKVNLNSVIVVELVLGSKKITIYFNKETGPILIETQEIFLKK
jgi:hypothetical protein